MLYRIDNLVIGLLDDLGLVRTGLAVAQLAPGGRGRGRDALV
jgi:hypothetical protein